MINADIFVSTLLFYRLPDHEYSPLRILKHGEESHRGDGSLAHKNLASELLGFLGRRLDVLDRDVDGPHRRVLDGRLHDPAHRALARLDDGVCAALGHRIVFGVPVEEADIELLGALGVVGVQLDMTEVVLHRIPSSVKSFQPPPGWPGEKGLPAAAG
jgi:hypothetical protein